MSQIYAAFDTETGGFDPTKADLLTFYMGFFDEEFRLLDEIDLKLKPDGRLPIAEAGALAVNKIDIQAHLANPETITYSEAKIKIVALIKKHLKKKGRFSNIRPLGYNVPFDLRWSQHHLISQSEWESLFHYKHVDVMQNVDFLKEADWFPSDLGSLGTVVDYLQIPKRNAHSAKDDTLMTIDVYKKILDIMKSKKEGGAAQDLISLLESE